MMNLHYYAQLNAHYLNAPRVLFAFATRAARNEYVARDPHAGTLYALREKVGHCYVYKWYDLSRTIPMELPEGCTGAYLRK